MGVKKKAGPKANASKDKAKASSSKEPVAETVDQADPEGDAAKAASLEAEIPVQLRERLETWFEREGGRIVPATDKDGRAYTYGALANVGSVFEICRYFNDQFLGPLYELADRAERSQQLLWRVEQLLGGNGQGGAMAITAVPDAVGEPKFAILTGLTGALKGCVVAQSEQQALERSALLDENDRLLKKLEELADQCKKRCDLLTAKTKQTYLLCQEQRAQAQKADKDKVELLAQVAALKEEIQERDDKTVELERSYSTQKRLEEQVAELKKKLRGSAKGQVIRKRIANKS
jgi:hypothetical protein